MEARSNVSITDQIVVCWFTDSKEKVCPKLHAINFTLVCSITLKILRSSALQVLG